MNKTKLRTSLFILCIGVVIAFLCGNRIEIFQKKLYFNEVCTNNFSNYSDKFGNYFNWIELYNPKNVAVSLEGYQVVKGNKKDKFVFGDVTLKAGEFLIVFLTDNVPVEENDEFYSGFEVNNEEGEKIFLLDAYDNIVDYVEIPVLGLNEAYARVDDKTAKWQIQESTPCGTNKGGQEIVRLTYEDSENKIIFSQKSGFYENAFELAISVEDDAEAEIYYTLDGSTPTRESQRYMTPFLIKDASDNPNVYSMRTDIVAQGKSEVGEIMPPESLIDKATVVRAVAYDKEGRQSKVVTGTFFVGFDKKQGYSDIEVISLVSDPVNFFDYDIGIYVSGKVGDGVQVTDDWLWQNTNYRRRGKSAEREVYVEYFSKNHSLLMRKECGIRTRGKATRAYQQKSFNLYAREEYDGTAQFEYDFWNDGALVSEITLASGGNDITTKARDYITSKLAEGLEFVACKYRPCVVFLNGEYWGLYYITEKANDEYINKYYGIQKDQVVMIRNWQIEEGDKKYLEELHEDMEYIGTANLTIEENYEKACSLIDIDSTVDYFAIQTCIGKCGDWLGEPEAGGNVGFWKSACSIQGTPYYDEKWRWILYDVNSGSMEEPMLDTISFVESKCFYSVFPNLMTNDEFREQYLRRVKELINTTTYPENANAVVEEIQQEIRPQVINTFQRYYEGLFTEENFDAGIAGIKNFYEERYNYLMTFVDE